MVESRKFPGKPAESWDHEIKSTPERPDFFRNSRFCIQIDFLIVSSQGSCVGMPKNILGWLEATLGPKSRLPSSDLVIMHQKSIRFCWFCLQLSSWFLEVIPDSSGDSEVIFGIFGIRRCCQIPKFPLSSSWSLTSRTKRDNEISDYE